MTRKELNEELERTKDKTDARFWLLEGYTGSEFDEMFHKVVIFDMYERSEENSTELHAEIGEDFVSAIRRGDSEWLRRVADALEERTKQVDQVGKLTKDLHDVWMAYNGQLKTHDLLPPLRIGWVVDSLKTCHKWNVGADEDAQSNFKKKVRREWKRCGFPDFEK